MHKLNTTLATALFFTTFLSALLSAAYISVANAELYKHVNPDGSVEFSDIPSHNDDEPIKLQPMSTFKAAPAPRTTSAPSQRPSTTVKYTSASISSPANEASIRDNAGNLTIKASVTPGLQSGHKLVLIDNGAAKGSTTTGVFNLTNIDRGEHALSVQVQDSKGKVLISSKTVTVYLQRISLIRPK